MSEMKFRKLTKDLSKSGRAVASINLNRKGAVSLSKELVSKTGWKAGDTVLLLAAENADGELTDWYLAKDVEGFELRESNHEGSLVFNSSGMVEEFFKLSVGSRTKTATLAVSTEAAAYDNYYWVNTVKPIKHEYLEVGR